MRLFWRKRDRKEPEPPSAEDQQVWTRQPSPIDALGRYGSGNELPLPLDLKFDPEHDKVYDDEIDPDWRDPSTEDEPDAG
jgi:hypothetical protein